MTSCGVVFIAFSSVERRNSFHWGQRTLYLPTDPVGTTPDTLMPLVNSAVSSILLTRMVTSAHLTFAKCDLEGLPGLLHETAGAFQHGKGGMFFIQVADLGSDTERGEQTPSTYPQEQFLLQAHSRL